MIYFSVIFNRQSGQTIKSLVIHQIHIVQCRSQFNTDFLKLSHTRLNNTICILAALLVLLFFITPNSINATMPK